MARFDALVMEIFNPSFRPVAGDVAEGTAAVE